MKPRAGRRERGGLDLMAVSPPAWAPWPFSLHGMAGRVSPAGSLPVTLWLKLWVGCFRGRPRAEELRHSLRSQVFFRQHPELNPALDLLPGAGRLVDGGGREGARFGGLGWSLWWSRPDPELDKHLLVGGQFPVARVRAVDDRLDVRPVSRGVGCGQERVMGLHKLADFVIKAFAHPECGAAFLVGVRVTQGLQCEEQLHVLPQEEIAFRRQAPAVFPRPVGPSARWSLGRRWRARCGCRSGGGWCRRGRRWWILGNQRIGEVGFDVHDWGGVFFDFVFLPEFSLPPSRFDHEGGGQGGSGGTLSLE